MKICIPTADKAGMKGHVHGHFGSAPFFTIVDTESRNVEVLDNANQHHARGTCHPLGSIEGKGVNIIIAAAMGGRIIQGLNLAKIKAYKTSAATVQEALDTYNNGILEAFSISTACSKDHCESH
jgi:predicted Fe-Mo cluster-binding NifX family protein